MELHPTQKTVAQDNHDYRVVVCGRQWGKTTLAVLEMIACAYSRNGREIAYFATTFDQARNIAWAMLKNASRNAWTRLPNESRLELYLKTQDKGESRITLRGFENVETARGQQFDFLVIDELAQMRNWDYAWQSILEPTLAFRKGKALFISTPLGYNHFHRLYEEGQKENDYYKSWKFKSEENPFLSKERIEQARRTSTEDYFAQEYLADFTKATGIALKQWNHGINLILPFNVPSEWQRGRGFDYGSAHPTASARVAIDNDDNWFVERCYNAKQSTIKDHAEAIKSQDYGFGFIPAYGDPSGAQWFTEFGQYDLRIEPANKEVGQNARGWVEHCIEKLNERLKSRPGHVVILSDGRTINNAPSLFVLDTPENEPLVKQIENLKWQTSKTIDEVLPILDESDDPTGGHYDLVAALRYFAVSYQKIDDSWDNINAGLDKKWRI